MLVETQSQEVSRAEAPSLIVTGNPNVGKSVLFQLLTGRYATVSNYPGTTVTVSRGASTLEGRSYQVFDTPGINTLAALSEDELVARQLLLARAATVVQVADAKNLQRALALTLELAEAGVPTVLALNMFDEARERRMQIDHAHLSSLLDIPVVPTIATQRWGLERLRRAIPKAKPAQLAVAYPHLIEEALCHLLRALPEELPSRKTVALLWLAGDRALMETIKDRLSPETIDALQRITAQAQEQSAVSLCVLIAHARMRQAQRVLARVMTQEPLQRLPRLRRLGDWAMHPVWGVPILAGVLAGMYVLVGDVAAQRGVDFFETIVFGRYVTPAVSAVVRALLPWAGAQDLFIGEYGVFTMAIPYAFAIILPIVTMFFLCFGLLEDVGYLPRLAVMANRVCRFLGLNGKAVLPLVLGLGCDTMATLTTRMLDTKRDRTLVTLLLALGIPCSAQLGVIMAMFAGLPPLALGIWLGVLVAVILVVGRVASRIIPGEATPLLYEIPPLRVPKFSNVLVKTLGRVEWYVKEAVPLFVLGTLALFILNAIGLLAIVERWASPLVVSWLGLPTQATGALLVGFLRRDFGAAGFFALQRAGELTGIQTVVSLVTITLFVPCVAQYFVMIKERGVKQANLIAGFVLGTAFLVGGILWRVLTALRVTL